MWDRPVSIRSLRQFQTVNAIDGAIFHVRKINEWRSVLMRPLKPVEMENKV